MACVRSSEIFPILQAPRDKLVCVLNCCRVINNLLHVQVQGEARGKPLMMGPESRIHAGLTSDDFC